jgi:hypothetical protein
MNQMSNYPDFSQLGYQVIRELGRNREAGRITYQATALNSDQQVVIKEFRFAEAVVTGRVLKLISVRLKCCNRCSIPAFLNT